MESLTGVNQFLVANSEMDSGSHKSRWDMLERQGVGKLSKSTGKAGEAGWENRQQWRETRSSEPSQGYWTPVATPRNVSHVSLFQILNQVGASPGWDCSTPRTHTGDRVSILTQHGIHST